MKNFVIDLGKKIIISAIVYTVSRDISDKFIEIRSKKMRNYEVVDM